MTACNTVILSVTVTIFLNQIVKREIFLITWYTSTNWQLWILWKTDELIIIKFDRWKGDKPSPVIRLEHTLFSGFELTAPPPQLEGGQHDKMAVMEHGNHGNAVWFVFANVTSPCPVCVRFHARSPYVISGLRPAYAQAYPVGRPDLMVETFYHVHDRNSLMLKAVSDEDLITWFGTAEGARKPEPDVACVHNMKNETKRHQMARINTAKLPTRLVKVDKPPNEYVLLNKESLWDLIKEAVNDDVKRKELSNILRETDD